MKKIICLCIIGLFLTSGITIIATSNESTQRTKIMNISYSNIEIEKTAEGYFDINLAGINTYYMKAGEPVLPKIIKTYELPFGAENVKVQVTPKNIHNQIINGDVRPGPIPVPLISTYKSLNNDPIKDIKVYSSEGPYPSEWFGFTVKCGLNENNKRVTYVNIPFYPVRYKPLENKLIVAESAEIKITYDEPDTTFSNVDEEFDLVIIGPDKFEKDLGRLIDHKNNFGIKTFFKSVEDIYQQYSSGRDKPEKIKYFIKDAIESHNIKYVLLVGGLKSLIFGRPRDHENYGARDWYVPVRYNNIFDNPKYPLAEKKVFDPGEICDLYYADVYRIGGAFEDWDPNGDGIIFGWDKEGYENDTGIDMIPDVALGRLACRNKLEVRIMVDKIITYEKNAYNQEWFLNTPLIAGDGFLDQKPLVIPWNTKSLDNGEYTIYARSNNPDGDYGPIDEIHVTIDKNAESSITFNHDDHLKFDTYPFDPIAEITSPSDSDILGSSDVEFSPGENVAYCNQFLGWANVSYIDGVMYIRGKTYDPRPYGNLTDIHVWVNNSNQETVFDYTVTDNEMYYEGEWVTGDKVLKGVGGALYYMPPETNEKLIWTSNGELTGQQDVIDVLNQGAGFVFFNGHGAPTAWGNHVAGIPGNRHHSHVNGLAIFSTSYPFFPMESLENTYKTPVTIVGGCHNSQFNVSLITTLFPERYPRMWTYGNPAPECFSWWLTRVSKRGSIATIGNTGLGYGVIGEDCTSVGLDGGIGIEFFKLYGESQTKILGDIYKQTQTNYVNKFDVSLQEHAKTLNQWILLGDPSLKIGGYPPEDHDLDISITNERFSENDFEPNENIYFAAITPMDETPPDTVEWGFDKDGDGTADIFLDGEQVNTQWEEPGVYWVEVKATYENIVERFDTIVDIKYDPEKPSKPEGSSNIKEGVEQTFQFKADDPYAEKIWYIVDWGDGEISFLEPEIPGISVFRSHIWSKKGNYQIRVKALGFYGEESPWSDPFSIWVTSKSKDKSSLNLVELLMQRFPRITDILELLLKI